MLLHINPKKDSLDAHDIESLDLLCSVPLTTIEFSVITVLFENRFNISSREQLNIAGWPDRIVGSNSLNVCIMHLRKKLKSVIPDSEIKVVPSYGYKLLIPEHISLVTDKEIAQINLVNRAAFLRTSITKSSPDKTDTLKLNTPKRKAKTASFPVRWGDIILSVFIWGYTYALYHSIYQ